MSDLIEGPHSIFNLDQEKSKLFVGGFPPSFQVQDSVISSSFEGEMEELMIGEVPVSFWNFVHGENNWKPAFERTKLMNLQPPTGYRFDQQGFAVISKKKLQLHLKPDYQNFRVQFKFKSLVHNGLMYLMCGKNYPSFLSIELRDGHVVYEFDMGDGLLTLTSPDKYNDGEWHTVEAVRSERVGVLSIDGERMNPRETPGNEKHLPTVDSIFFGAYPPSLQPCKPSVRTDFEGCIDEVIFQETTVDLTKNSQSANVAAGCPVKVSTKAYNVLYTCHYSHLIHPFFFTVFQSGVIRFRLSWLREMGESEYCRRSASRPQI